MSKAQESELPPALAEMVHAPPIEVRAWDPVNVPMIRHYCEAVGIENPIYVDEAEASKGPHGAIVAPASMLYDWTMPGYTGRSPGGDCREPGREVAACMAREGFPDVVAVRLQHEYYRYPRVGERLTRLASIAAIGSVKKTALGEGRFISEDNVFVNETGERVGRAVISFLCYKPAGRPVESSLPAAAVAASSVPECAPISIDVTATFIVATALATRDYQNVHHDRAAAQQAGARDIFLNILTAMGIVQRCVEQWFGRDAILESIDLSLVGQLYPGHRLSLVAGSVNRADDGRVRVEMTGNHQEGPFIRAVANARTSPAPA